MKRFALVLALTAGIAIAQDSHLGVALEGLAGTPEHRVRVAKEMGATWYWRGPVLLRGDAKCDDCQAARAAGLKLALVVRNAETAGKPGSTVTDAADFQKKLRAVLERYQPALLVVEDEPEDPKNFNGTPEQYKTELGTACQVSRDLGIACANGGLGSEDVAMVVIDQRYKTDPVDAGNVATTTELVRVAGGGTDLRILGRTLGSVGGKQAPAVEATRKFLDKHRREIDQTRKFIEAINQAGVDRLNFHWFELQVDNLSKVVDSLHELSKLDLMCDSMADKSDRVFVVGEKIRIALDNYVWPIIWVGTDERGMMGLVDKKGKLRPAARAFQAAAAHN